MSYNCTKPKNTVDRCARVPSRVYSTRQVKGEENKCNSSALKVGNEVMHDLNRMK